MGAYAASRGRPYF